MRPVLTVTFFALALAGCATGYDKAAVPDAAAAMHQASQRCEDLRAANDLKTHSEYEACELAAERAFAVAVHLKRMDSFEDYATAMQALAADRDADRITANQVKYRADAIRGEFLADCACAPRTGRRWSTDYSVPLMGNSSDGGALSMGQGNHAMGPGPLNF